MCNIESFVFFDIETTGLPWQERNRTKITELCFVAALRKDLIRTNFGKIPPVSKITLVFNPIVPIHPKAAQMTGLSNDLLQYAPKFETRTNIIVSFLQGLPKPVCLVAHNGNKFDYKIILAEFVDAHSSLPKDLLCIDSLIGFKQLLKDTDTHPVGVSKTTVPRISNFDISLHDILTDDEDEWPELDVSLEDWEDINRVCENKSFQQVNPIQRIKQKTVASNKNKRGNSTRSKTNFKEFSLGALYKHLVNKEACNSHRAEGDCLMLLECVVAIKDKFIPWADRSCKQISAIEPLARY